MRLLGLFIAEGHVSGNHIGWSFHERETDLIDFVVATLATVFGLPSSRNHNAPNHCTQVIATAKPLADALRALLGANSMDRRLPMEWLGLSDDLLQPLWQGVMDGDGDHVGIYAGRRISLANPLLARGMVDLGRRLGYSVSLHEERGGACRIHVNQRADTEVRTRELLTTDYEGPVYNLEVEDDHSYVVEGYAVHNCWKIGESFVKVKGRESDVYGHLYDARKAYETVKNERGDYAPQAVRQLQRFKIGADTVARAFYEKGMLPPGHIHSRCKRFAVKAFLWDYFAEGYRRFHHEEPPKPYAISILGHANFYNGAAWRNYAPKP